MEPSAYDIWLHPTIDFALNITDIGQQKVRLTFDSNSQSVYFLNSDLGNGPDYTNDPPRSTITFEKVIQS